jgi:hypothetical protein
MIAFPEKWSVGRAVSFKMKTKPIHSGVDAGMSSWHKLVKPNNMV